MSIQKIEVLYAGYCVNDEKRMFKGAGSKKVIFPAACVLLKHDKEGYVLFDTGYSCETDSQKGLVGFLYKKLNPDYIEPENELVSILKRKGIAQNEIKTVLISHLHPDHIGGLRDFKNASYIISQSAYGVYENPKMKSLVFKDLFPKDFSERVVKISADFRYNDLFPAVYDFFKDGSMLLVPIEGHAKGQMGLYIPEANIFFAADACWKGEYFGRTKEMRAFPKFLQNNFSEYTETQKWLKDVYQSGIKIIYSHDTALENGSII